MPVENILAKDDSKAFSEPFHSVCLLRVALQLGNEVVQEGQAEQKARTHWDVARHWKQSGVFGDLYQMTYSCSSHNAHGVWFINCFCFPRRPRRLEWDQAVAEGPSS